MDLNQTSLDYLDLVQNVTFPDRLDDCILDSGVRDPADIFAPFRDQTRFVVQRILVPCLVPVGLLGNMATIGVMTRPRMRSSTSHYLAALALFDLLYLLGFFVLSLKHYPGFHYYHAPYWKAWPFWIMLTDISSNTSVWLTVTFTVERYIAVCHPMRGKVLCTESRAKKMIILVLVTCFFVTLPTAFEWNHCEAWDPRVNLTYYRETSTSLGMNESYMIAYSWTITILFSFSPLMLLIVFNSFLIRSVRSSRSLRRTMTQHREASDTNNQERKITIMLIAVVVLFVVCQLPSALMTVYTSFPMTELGRSRVSLHLGLNNIFNFLMHISAAGNFLLYSLLSQKYRRTFVQTFCPCLKGRMQRLRSVYQTTVYTTVSESPRRSARVISLQTLPPAWDKETPT